MAERIKVYNPQKFDVGVVTFDRPMGLNIAPGSFALLTEDDISYIASISTLFQRGYLRVDKKEETVMQAIGIDPETNPAFITDEEIQKRLGGTPKKIGEWLDTVKEPYILDRVYDIAVKMNLTMSKLKTLREHMPERTFVDEE